MTHQPDIAAAAQMAMHARPAARPRLGLLDLWMLVLLVVPIYGTFYPPETYFSIGGGTPLPYPITPVILVTVSLSIVALYVRARLMHPIRHSPMAYAFFAVALASLIWSPDPQLTFQRALRLLPPIGLGLLLPQYYTTGRLLYLLILAFLISAIASIGISLGVPSLGLSNMGNGYENAWRGAIINKNTTGLLYAIGLIVAYYGYRARVASPVLCSLTALTCLFMLLMADSATSIVSTAVAFAVGMGVTALRRVPGSVAFLLTVAILTLLFGLVAVLAFVPEQVFGLIGRDLTFTGRTDIWASVWDIVWDRPLIGHGYSFWIIDSPAHDQIVREVGYLAAHSHNSWLDLLLQVGLAGLANVVILFVMTFAVSVRHALRSTSSLAPMYLVVMTFLLIRSMTEVEFSEPGISALFWLLWVAVETGRRPA